MQFNGGVYNSDIWRQKFRDGPYLVAQNPIILQSRLLFIYHNLSSSTETFRNCSGQICH